MVSSSLIFSVQILLANDYPNLQANLEDLDKILIIALEFDYHQAKISQHSQTKMGTHFNG